MSIQRSAVRQGTSPSQPRAASSVAPASLRLPDSASPTPAPPSSGGNSPVMDGGSPYARPMSTSEAMGYSPTPAGSRNQGYAGAASWLTSRGNPTTTGSSSSAYRRPQSAASQQPQYPRTGSAARVDPVPSAFSPQRPATSAAACAHKQRAAALEFGCGMLIHQSDPENPARIIRTYKCGKKLGEGAFAKVFEVSDASNGEIYAAKVIDKYALVDSSKRKKLLMEIRLHKRLNHQNILHFAHEFQDDHYHYLILERCLSLSLMELSKMRKTFTVPEAQYIMLQLLDATGYLHSQNVIHRDLKLANVMVDCNMNMKVGDFGLATELQYAGQRKWTRCGTPNYIAPEVLGESEGYGFACDIWSLGVILYTLLVGIPPFETANLQTTYSRIQQGKFSFPATCSVPHTARSLIMRMLQCQPEKRPSLVEIRMDPFFRGAPKEAPAALIRSMRPDELESLSAQMRRQSPVQPAQPVSADRTVDAALSEAPSPTSRSPVSTSPPATPTFPSPEAIMRHVNGVAHVDPMERHFHSASKPASGSSNIPKPSMPETDDHGEWSPDDREPSPEQQQQQHHQQHAHRKQAEHPLLQPRKVPVQVLNRVNQNDRGACSISADLDARGGTASRDKTDDAMDNTSSFRQTFVVRILDYSRKYGVACELSDGSLSSVFNDRTKLIWKPSNGSVAYHCRETRHLADGHAVQADNLVDAFVVDEEGVPVPSGAPTDRQTTKKMTLSKYFRTCLDAATMKERVASVALFPYLEPPFSTQRAPESSATGGAAALSKYVKSVSTVSVSIDENGDAQFAMVSNSVVIPTSADSRTKVHCLVIRLSDGSAQVVWEANTFDSDEGNFVFSSRLSDAAANGPLDATKSSIPQDVATISLLRQRLQRTLSLRGCGLVAVLDEAALRSSGGLPTDGSIALSPCRAFVQSGQGHLAGNTVGMEDLIPHSFLELDCPAVWGLGNKSEAPFLRTAWLASVRAVMVVEFPSTSGPTPGGVGMAGSTRGGTSPLSDRH